MIERDDDKVCIVGATTAWPFYRLTGAYVCQENRYIQEDTGRLGFYTSRLIQGVAPRILSVWPSVGLLEDEVANFTFDTDPELRRVGLVAAAALSQGVTDPAVQIVLLSPLDDPGTSIFESIRHDGRGAWTQRQRYARLDQLQNAITTDDLVAQEPEAV